MRMNENSVHVHFTIQTQINLLPINASNTCLDSNSCMSTTVCIIVNIKYFMTKEVLKRERVAYVVAAGFLSHYQNGP